MLTPHEMVAPDNALCDVAPVDRVAPYQMVAPHEVRRPRGVVEANGVAPHQMVTPNQVLRPVHRLVADPRLRNSRKGKTTFEREVVRLKTTLDIGQREPLRQLD